MGHRRSRSVEGAVWVVNSLDDTVSRIDPRHESRHHHPGRRDTRRHCRRRGRRLGDREAVVKLSRVGMVALGAAVLALIAGNAPSRAEGPATAIKIGVLTDCTGASGASSTTTRSQAPISRSSRAVRPQQGRVPETVSSARRSIGRPIELSFGCSDGSPASALEEARRLVERVGVSVLIGPLNGDEELALQAYARRRPAIAFVNGSAAVHLQHPAPNFFSFHADGAQWSAGTGSYAYRELGWRRAVTITDDHDTFNWSQTAGFVAEFCSLGGTIVKRVGVPSGPPTSPASLAQLPRVGVDGVYVATSEAVPVALLKAYSVLRHDAARKLMIGAFDVEYVFAVRGRPTHGPRVRGPGGAGRRGRLAFREGATRGVSATRPGLRGSLRRGLLRRDASDAAGSAGHGRRSHPRSNGAS